MTACAIAVAAVLTCKKNRADAVGAGSPYWSVLAMTDYKASAAAYKAAAKKYRKAAIAASKEVENYKIQLGAARYFNTMLNRVVEAAHKYKDDMRYANRMALFVTLKWLDTTTQNTQMAVRKPGKDAK